VAWWVVAFRRNALNTPILPVARGTATGGHSNASGGVSVPA
jgi:hypothetical protein